MRRAACPDRPTLLHSPGAGVPPFAMGGFAARDRPGGVESAVFEVSRDSPAGASRTAALLHELLALGLGRLARPAVALLQETRELLGAPLGPRELVVRELAPLLLRLPR